MAITDTDSLVAALTGPSTTQTFSSTVATAITTVNQPMVLMASSWAVGHRRGLPSAIPTTGEWCTPATPGAHPLPALAAGKTWHVAALSGAGGAPHLTVLDRLAHLRADLSKMTWTDPMTLPPRSTTGHGVMLFAESTVTTTGGSVVVQPTYTVTYTNSDGVAGRTGQIGSYGSQGGSSIQQNNNTAGLMMPMLPALGDKGVASVQQISATVPVATGWSSVVFVLARIVYQSFVSYNGHGFTAGYLDIGQPRLGDDPCLFMAGDPRQTGIAPGMITARLVQG